MCDRLSVSGLESDRNAFSTFFSQLILYRIAKVMKDINALPKDLRGKETSGKYVLQDLYEKISSKIDNVNDRQQLENYLKTYDPKTDWALPRCCSSFVNTQTSCSKDVLSQSPKPSPIFSDFMKIKVDASESSALFALEFLTVCDTLLNELQPIPDLILQTLQIEATLYDFGDEGFIVAPTYLVYSI